MSDFRAQLFQERTELQQRITSLEEFISGETFKELVPCDKAALRDQRKCMQAYLDVLNRRVWHLCNRSE